MISYKAGDATDPKGLKPVIIAHICNDYGGWGRGFVVALSKKWSEPEYAYRTWFQGKLAWLDSIPEFKLGNVEFVHVASGIRVANMIAQHGDATPDHRAVQYDALESCLLTVAETARRSAAFVAMPRIGCGLGGGAWADVEAIINKTLSDIKVVVYDLC